MTLFFPVTTTPNKFAVREPYFLCQKGFNAKRIIDGGSQVTHAYAHAPVHAHVSTCTHVGEGHVNRESRKGKECFFQLINQYIKVCIKKLILKPCIVRFKTVFVRFAAARVYLSFRLCNLMHLPFSAQRHYCKR